jgi:hypothetical protein
LHAFIVNLENRRGTLADLGTALGERGINITGLAATTWGGTGSVAIVTNDDAATVAALDEAGFDYRETELVSAQIEDRPGALGEAARRIADRNVNIELVMPTDTQGTRATIAFGVDDAERAREALGELAAVGSQAV